MAGLRTAARGRMPWLDRKRGRCSECGETFSLKNDGTLWSHKTTVDGKWGTCLGAGKKPRR